MFFTTTQNIQIAEKNMLPALQDAMYAEQTQSAIEYIAQTHDISDFELSALVGYVLLGLIPVAHLADELEDSCGLYQDEALAVVVDVRRYILAPVAREVASIQEIAKKNYNTYKQ